MAWEGTGAQSRCPIKSRYHYQLQQKVAMALVGPPDCGCCLSCGSCSPLLHLSFTPTSETFHFQELAFDCSPCVMSPFLMSSSCASLFMSPCPPPGSSAKLRCLYPGNLVLPTIQAGFPHSPSVTPSDCPGWVAKLVRVKPCTPRGCKLTPGQGRYLG